MSEIEKMYENAGAYDFRYDCDVSFADGDFGRITNCTKGEVKDYCTDKIYFKSAKVINVKHLYPPCTAEKQILLIQWLLDRADLYLHRHKTDFTYSIASGDYAVNKYKDFKESIAEFINVIWQDLTETEQEEIRNILKG